MWVISVVNSIRLRLREHTHTDTRHTVVFLTWPVMLLRMVRVTLAETCKQSLNLPAVYPNCESRKSSKSEWRANPLLSGGWRVQVRQRKAPGVSQPATQYRVPLYANRNMNGRHTRYTGLIIWLRRRHAWDFTLEWMTSFQRAGGQAWRQRLTQVWLPLETEHLL